MNKPSIFEYLPTEASSIMKLAETQKPVDKPITHGLKTIGSGLAYMGLGTLGGYAGGALLGEAFRGITGKQISPGFLRVPAALAGAGASLAYRKYKEKELEELQRAAESHRNKSKGTVPGQ